MKITRAVLLVCSLATVLTFALGAFSPARADDGRVEPAERFFVDGPLDIPISIRLPSGQTLVFDEKFNDRYITKGRELRLRVSKLQIIGNPVIRIWNPASTAPPQANVGAPGPAGGRGGDGGYPSGGRGGDGQPGAKGPDGNEGTPGRDVTIEADEIVGDGKLTIVTSGIVGGVGGTGGRGGDGGQGGDGRNRSDSDIVGFPPRVRGGNPPGNGGQGGTGGEGGRGGTGGVGGPGSNVYHYAELCPMLKAGRITVAIDGAIGGPPGQPGGPGNPGGGGGFGHGSRDGGGGSNGPGGAPGSIGPAGSNGPSGKAGELRCLSETCVSFKCPTN